MRYGLSCSQAHGLWAGLVAVGLAVALVGCHGQKEPSIAGVPVEQSAALADRGAAAIAAVCSRQSFATAKVGLIAGETRLSEDVFEMRDPVSYTVVPYRLATTVRLETTLRRGAAAAGRPEAQAQCMKDFADHLKELTDPLVAEAKNQSQEDLLAFKDAEKEAQQEIEAQEEKDSR
ncbi:MULTISPECIES: hypothetical protein [Acidobacteriaceae]|uniref:hypothetical protein n=1 Tax=Acidobacteriaceae TaxID=204434 RepID=UPI00131E0315|nr:MULTISPECIES: hypothetical protein [Acidobacteriaceae]MDW5267517.1 hypothetical protein [Edaphobacter sp.]